VCLAPFNNVVRSPRVGCRRLLLSPYKRIGAGNLLDDTF
jgi:hypothetical protein